MSRCRPCFSRKGGSITKVSTTIAAKIPKGYDRSQTLLHAWNLTRYGKFIGAVSLFVMLPMAQLGAAANLALNFLDQSDSTVETAEFVTGIVSALGFTMLCLLNVLYFDRKIVKLLIVRFDYWLLMFWITTITVLAVLLCSGGFAYMLASVCLGGSLWVHIDAVNPRFIRRQIKVFIISAIVVWVSLGMMVFNITSVKVVPILAYTVNDVPFGFSLRGLLIEGSTVLTLLFNKRLILVMMNPKHITYYYLHEENEMKEISTSDETESDSGNIQEIQVVQEQTNISEFSSPEYNMPSL